jgi:hypothetical protein
MTVPFGSRTKNRRSPPLLVGEWVDDLGSRLNGSLVNRVDVVNLNGDIRVDAGLDVQFHHAERHLASAGAEEQDPVQAAMVLQPDHVLVEGPALIEPIRLDIGLIRLTAMGEV